MSTWRECVDTTTSSTISSVDPNHRKQQFRAMEEAGEAVEHVGVLCGVLGEELERGGDVKKA